MQSNDDAIEIVRRAWKLIAEECRSVLGGELHYQAMIYHCFRLAGAPREQIGMNVKQWIEGVTSELFVSYDTRKHPDFRGGFEPIPDLVLFSPGVQGDWRRRQFRHTLQHMLLAIEIKASERKKSRLGLGEIKTDILKLAAHRSEVQRIGSDFIPVMMIIDTAPEPSERMHTDALSESVAVANREGVRFLYVSPTTEMMIL